MAVLCAVAFAVSPSMDERRSRACSPERAARCLARSGIERLDMRNLGEVGWVGRGSPDESSLHSSDT
jgi:hypothetical protein